MLTIIMILGCIPPLWMVYRIIEKQEHAWIFGIGFYYIPAFPLALYFLDQLFRACFDSTTRHASTNAPRTGSRRFPRYTNFPPFTQPAIIFRPV